VIGVPARTSPTGANLSSINPVSSTQTQGGDGISALGVAHFLGGQASHGWHFDFSSRSGSGGIPEPEGSFPGIADNKLLTALMSDAQAGQPFQPTDGGHEPPGHHDGMTVGSAALADLHAGYFHPQLISGGQEFRCPDVRCCAWSVAPPRANVSLAPSPAGP
jgi:hypothetical protein